MVSLMVYAMIPFRAHNVRPAATSSAGSPAGAVAIASAGASGQARAHQSAPAKAKAGTAGTSAAPTAGASAGPGHTAPPRNQAAARTTPAAAGP